LSVLGARLGVGRKQNYVPVPENRKGLVNVQKPNWGVGHDDKFKATWIGHASWMLETTFRTPAKRGVRVLCDPVFSERTSPFSFFGPKRYTPTPCAVSELPEIDVVIISHNHYDHLDINTIRELLSLQPNVHILCPLGNKAWFLSINAGLGGDQVTELDWWESVKVDVNKVGSISIVCTPAQHTSARSGTDKNKTLWSSWAVQEGVPQGSEKANDDTPNRKVFFAGDTGYRHVNSANPTKEEEENMPRCPAFKEIGQFIGPFDLALLPIGLYSPRDFMSAVHCAPEDSVCIHQDIQSKLSVGMHYGTVRGGISEHYEDVLEPPVRFREACEKEGLKWGEDARLCDVGETVLVD